MTAFEAAIGVLKLTNLYCYQTSRFSSSRRNSIMIYRDMPLMIPLLASGYLLAIYALLILAQRSRAWRRP